MRRSASRPEADSGPQQPKPRSQNKAGKSSRPRGKAAGNERTQQAEPRQAPESGLRAGPERKQRTGQVQPHESDSKAAHGRKPETARRNTPGRRLALDRQAYSAAPAHPIQRPKAASGRPGRLEIIFEDRHIIAVEKPAGLPVIAAEGSRGRSLYDMVTAHIQRRNARGRAALVHRLDRDTSGIMIFATDARTKTALMAHWNEALTRRLYTALVEGCPPHEEGLLDSWLLESSPSRVLEVPAGSRGAQRALTRYRIIGQSEHFTLLELSLETGRRHQIRVQLASIGCPVAGDERYAALSDPYQRLCLHASLLELQHPFANQLLCLESPVQPFAVNTAERNNLAQKSRRS